MAILQLKKLLWIYDQLSSNDPMTLDELKRRWKIDEVDGENKLPTSSFRKYKNDLESLFDIDVECKTEGLNYLYTVVDNGDKQGSAGKKWLIQLLNLELSDSHKKLVRDRTIIENAPLGSKYINQITTAISKSRKVEIAYKSFFDTEIMQLQIAPYWLKMYNQRWYLVGKSSLTDELYPYALDRIHELKLLDESFVFPKNCSATEYFYNSVGITVDMDYDIETMQFKVYGTQQNYIETLPIHHSQVKIKETSNYSLFEIVVRPSYELFEKLIAQQYHLEILSPKWIREEMAAIIEDMAKRYR